MIGEEESLRDNVPSSIPQQRVLGASSVSPWYAHMHILGLCRSIGSRRLGGYEYL
jgi:hypothetical protein